jgi:hypothetical protein
MNLGAIYLSTFLWLTALSFCCALVFTVILRRIWKPAFIASLLVTIGGGLALSYVSNATFHQALFLRRHESQNKWVPNDGRITYSAEFASLYATYSMTETEFRNWAANYEVPLKTYDNTLLMNDINHFDLDGPEISLSTVTGGNGKQIRVYYKNETMFFAYNSM